MNHRPILAPIAMVAMLLSACDARYRDVSSEPEHKTLVGKVCNVEVDLRAHGVALKLERDQKTDYISIWNPGFTGPEMTFLVLLPPGTKLEVVAARECKNCPFDRGLEYKVKVDPEPATFGGKPAYIRSESLAMPYVKCPGNAA